MKHDNWDIYKCTYCLEQEAPTDESLHCEYMQLQSAVEELFYSLESQRKLDAEFVKVDQNTSTERTTSGVNMCLKKLRRLINWKEQS